MQNKGQKALLIILGILIMLCFSCKEKKQNIKVSKWGKTDWPVFRGNPQLTGFVEAETGANFSIKWTYKLEDVLISSPVIVKDILYTAAQSGSIYAFSLVEKSLLWQIQIDDSFESSPVFRDGFLYIGSFSGSFFKIDSRDGKIIWKKKIGTRIAGSANFLPLEASPVFFGSYDSRFYSLDPQNGEINKDFQAKNYINGSPAAEGRQLAFGSCDGKLYLIDGTKGRLDKVYDFGNYIAGSPVFYNHQITAAAYNGTIKSYSLENHSLLWEWTAPSEQGFIASPATDGQSLVIGNKDGALYALDARSGKLKWEFLTGGDIEASALIVGEKVFFGSSDGYFYIVSLTEGKQIQSFALNGIPYTGAAWYKGNIYCLTDSGLIYCIGN